MLVKVKADSKTRAEIVQTADLFHARVVHVDKQALIIQCTGNPNKMAAFMNMIEPFGIIDMARTGNLMQLCSFLNGKKIRHSDEKNDKAQ